VGLQAPRIDLVEPINQFVEETAFHIEPCVTRWLKC
jgi:hypothetical protein